MGWALPAAIGVAKAGAKNVIVIVGDGSFMSNMQELAVIREHNLPIKIIILNNQGISQHQEHAVQVLRRKRARREHQKLVCGSPDFEEVARTFKIDTRASM
jgi:acetolactate synthase-1/2/3 large subunit